MVGLHWLKYLVHRLQKYEVVCILCDWLLLWRWMKLRIQNHLVVPQYRMVPWNLARCCGKQHNLSGLPESSFHGQDRPFGLRRPPLAHTWWVPCSTPAGTGILVLPSTTTKTALKLKHDYVSQISIIRSKQTRYTSKIWIFVWVSWPSRKTSPATIREGAVRSHADTHSTYK